MKQAIQATLPAGYYAVHTLDVRKIHVRLCMDAAALTVLISTMAAAFTLLRPLDGSATVTVAGLVAFVAALSFYAIVHGLLHGLAWRLSTERRLTFHLSLRTAYFGVPDVYVSRGAARLILLAPFLVLTLIFAAVMLAMHDPMKQFLCAVLLSVHISASLDDLFCLLLLRSPDTLMQETAHTRTFYQKEP